MEPTETPVVRTYERTPNTPHSTVFTCRFIIYETSKDSFSVGGNRYYAHDHGFTTGDTVRVTISRDRNDLKEGSSGTRNGSSS
jgi:hypothetical protein